MYDTKCYDLAEHFLSDLATATEADRKFLAQGIQDYIEGFLTYEFKIPDGPDDLTVHESQ